MRRLILPLVALAAMALGAGCGAESPEEQIQSTTRAAIKALKADRVGDYCRLTTNHRECLETLVAARAFGIRPSDLLSGEEERKIATRKLTIRGDHARSSLGSEFIKRDGKWLIVWKGQP